VFHACDRSVFTDEAKTLSDAQNDLASVAEFLIHYALNRKARHFAEISIEHDVF
jgi:hypothetical protein